MSQLLNQLFGMLLAVSLGISGLVTVVAANGPNKPFSADRNAATGDADEIMQTARESLPILSVLIDQQKRSIKEKLEELSKSTQKSIDQQADSDNLLKQLIREVDIGGLTTQTVTALKQNEALIKTTLAKKDDELKTFQDLCQHLAGLENTRQLLEKLSRDRALAATIAELIRSNNRTALGNLLKANTSTNTSSSTSPNDGSTAPIEVREAKDTNGLILVFRIYGLTQCLSTTLQCSGKSYSVTK